MLGDSRHESHAPVAIERLLELIPEIDSNLATVREFVNACMAGEHSDLSSLEAFDADFCSQQLYDRMALARGYFEQLGIGPDAEALLHEAAKLRDDVHDYGVELVGLADAAKGGAAAEADVLQASDELHDRAIVLNLDLSVIGATYATVTNWFQRSREASGFADGIGQIVEEPRAQSRSPNIDDAIADADRATYRPANVPADAGDAQPAVAGFLGGVALADALDVHATRRDAFFRQLERHRIRLGDDCWHEVSEPRPNSPRFLYRVDAPRLRNLAADYKNPKLD